jgi:hypothetical protein
MEASGDGLDFIEPVLPEALPDNFQAARYGAAEVKMDGLARLAETKEVAEEPLSRA